MEPGNSRVVFPDSLQDCPFFQSLAVLCDEGDVHEITFIPGVYLASGCLFHIWSYSPFVISQLVAAEMTVMSKRVTMWGPIRSCSQRSFPLSDSLQQCGSGASRGCVPHRAECQGARLQSPQRCVVGFSISSATRNSPSSLLASLFSKQSHSPPSPLGPSTHSNRSHKVPE